MILIKPNLLLKIQLAKSILQHFIIFFNSGILFSIVLDLVSYSVYAVVTCTEKLDSKVKKRLIVPFLCMF